MRNLLFAMGLTLASAAHAQPTDVARGADLTVWQQLELRKLSGDEAVTAYRAFVVEWSQSPLAVVAFERLETMGAAEGAWRAEPAARAAAEDVARRWAAHERALAAHLADSAPVAVLVLDGDAAVVADD